MNKKNLNINYTPYEVSKSIPKQSTYQDEIKTQNTSKPNKYDQEKHDLIEKYKK